MIRFVTWNIGRAQYAIVRSGEPVRIRKMSSTSKQLLKNLYRFTHRATTNEALVYTIFYGNNGS